MRGECSPQIGFCGGCWYGGGARARQAVREALGKTYTRVQLSTESVDLAQRQAADAEARLREAAALLDTERGGRLEATGQVHALQDQLAQLQESLSKVRLRLAHQSMT